MENIGNTKAWYLREEVRHKIVVLGEKMRTEAKQGDFDSVLETAQVIHNLYKVENGKLLLVDYINSLGNPWKGELVTILTDAFDAQQKFESTDEFKNR